MSLRYSGLHCRQVKSSRPELCSNAHIHRSGARNVSGTGFEKASYVTQIFWFALQAGKITASSIMFQR